jgi:hypothetical protein
VIARNPDFTIVKQIASNSFRDDVTLLKYSDLVSYFMFASVTSCDVERSFSKFKDILTSKRSSFTAENLEKYIVIQTYYSNNGCFFKFGVEVGVELSIVNALYRLRITDQLFQS